MKIDSEIFKSKCPLIEYVDREFETREEVLQGMIVAPNILSFYNTNEGENNFLFTDLGEDEFIMAMIAIGKDARVLNFFKLVLSILKEYKKDPVKGHKLALEAINYIKISKNKFKLF